MVECVENVPYQYQRPTDPETMTALQSAVHAPAGQIVHYESQTVLDVAVRLGVTDLDDVIVFDSVEQSRLPVGDGVLEPEKVDGLLHEHPLQRLVPDKPDLADRTTRQGLKE